MDMNWSSGRWSGFRGVLESRVAAHGTLIDRRDRRRRPCRV